MPTLLSAISRPLDRLAYALPQKLAPAWATAAGQRLELYLGRSNRLLVGRLLPRTLSRPRRYSSHQLLYNFDTLKQLEYAHYLGTPGNCGPTNTWYCETVDTQAGMHNSLAVGALNMPHISYYASDQNDLKYAHKVRLIFLPIARKP